MSNAHDAIDKLINDSDFGFKSDKKYEKGGEILKGPKDKDDETLILKRIAELDKKARKRGKGPKGTVSTTKPKQEADFEHEKKYFESENYKKPPKWAYKNKKYQEGGELRQPQKVTKDTGQGLDKGRTTKSVAKSRDIIPIDSSKKNYKKIISDVAADVLTGGKVSLVKQARAAIKKEGEILKRKKANKKKYSDDVLDVRKSKK